MTDEVKPQLTLEEIKEVANCIVNAPCANAYVGQARINLFQKFLAVAGVKVETNA